MTTFHRVHCRFACGPHAPTAEFAGVVALADHIHDLRQDRPIFLRRLRVAGEGWAAEAIVVHWADEAGETDAPLGYAVLGRPPLNGAVQYELLGAALAAAMPAFAQAA